MYTITETYIYKWALENRNIFPLGIYELEEIYDLIIRYVPIPDHHLENRPDVSYPKFKNYFHTVRRNISRIEYLGNELYRFK